MNMMDSSFLCLDIGTSGVRGIANRIRNAKIDKTAYYSVDDFDTVFALKSVIDELENQIGVRFDTAYITGNFGPSYFKMTAKNTVWPNDHKITGNDIKSQISEIDAPDGFYPMHIIPLRYDTPKIRNMLSPIGHSDRQLVSAYSALFFDGEQMQKLLEILRHAHIQPNAFYTPHFLANAVLRTKKTTVMFIDFGAEYTTVSLWTDRGPVWYNAYAIGGNDLTSEISTRLNIPFTDAERIKKSVADLQSNEMSRFSPADPAYAFSCADVNDIVTQFYSDLLVKIKSDSVEHIEKYNPTEIIITGGGTRINGIVDELNGIFNIPITTTDSDTTVRTLAKYVWMCEEPHRNAYISRTEKIQHRIDKILKVFRIHRKHRPQKKQIPILPSSLCFDMSNPTTYTMFESAGISAIHIDIMDGLYVDKIASGLDELRKIRQFWNGHLHVHLMTEAPSEWAIGAIESGADTVILSTNTSGLRNAIQIVHASNHRVGIALNPDSPVSLLKTVLRDLDEVMIMAVKPGAAGQKFNKNVLQKISMLAATRKKYGLKFIISVDGGINSETAQLCWDAGADALVSGSYLASEPDFPIAVMSLLKPDNHKVIL
jgi:ribulose-phosphate 3-epimerase